MGFSPQKEKTWKGKLDMLGLSVGSGSGQFEVSKDPLYTCMKLSRNGQKIFYKDNISANTPTGFISFLCCGCFNFNSICKYK